jgi:hypothetical protein
MVKRQIPKTARIRIISEDPQMVTQLLILIEGMTGLTPLESNNEPQKGRGNNTWIGYQTVLIDPTQLEALIEK